MSWTDDQFDRLRDKLILAKRQGVHLVSSEVNLVLGVMAFWRRMTRAVGWPGLSEGKIPTIGQMRKQGIEGVIVECEAQECRNRRKLSFDDLGLGDAVVFIEIGRHRGFRCTRCRGRRFTIAADHKNPIPPGGGSSHSDIPFPDPTGERR